MQTFATVWRSGTVSVERQIVIFFLTLWAPSWQMTWRCFHVILMQSGCPPTFCPARIAHVLCCTMWCSMAGVSPCGQCTAHPHLTGLWAAEQDCNHWSWPLHQSFADCTVVFLAVLTDRQPGSQWHCWHLSCHALVEEIQICTSCKTGRSSCMISGSICYICAFGTVSQDRATLVTALSLAWHMWWPCQCIAALPRRSHNQAVGVAYDQVTTNVQSATQCLNHC